MKHNKNWSESPTPPTSPKMANAILWNLRRKALEIFWAPLPRLRAKKLAQLGPNPMPEFVVDEMTWTGIMKAATALTKIETDPASFIVEGIIRDALLPHQVRGSLNIALERFRRWYRWYLPPKV